MLPLFVRLLGLIRKPMLLPAIPDVPIPFRLSLSQILWAVLYVILTASLPDLTCASPSWRCPWCHFCGVLCHPGRLLS